MPASAIAVRPARDSVSSALWEAHQANHAADWQAEVALLRNIFTYLKDGATIDASVDGSVTPAVYSFSPTENCEIHRMIVYIEDNGAVTASSYGSVSTLSNGIDVEHTDGNTVVDMLDGVPIVSNASWAALCYDAQEVSFSGGGNSAVGVRWTFARSGSPIKMESGDTLRVRINDNLTGLVAHRFQIQGFYK